MSDTSRMHQRNTSSKERLYEDLKQRIMAGEFLPGVQLSPRALAAHYRTSLTPLRDALHALAQEGLVEVIPRRGYFISRVTVRDVLDIFQLRLILETAAAEIATPRISLAEIERLAALSSRYVAGNIESYKAYLNENREFHLSVARATGNRLLVEALARILEQMQRLLVLRLDLSDDADAMLAEHHLLLDAFRRRDAHGAREAMRIAIEHARDAVLESIFRHSKDWAI